jgi:hypothetical protein
MTEQEARTKWCPFFRTAVAIGPMGLIEWSNRDNIGVMPTICIGSACMAWRWDRNKNDGTEVVPPKHGHCGLAGKP